MPVTSRSYLLGLIGEGVRPSLTPPMHEAEAAAQGLPLVYRPVDLLELGRPGSDVGALLRAGRDLGFDGFNVTHPCKQLVLEHLDEVDPVAARLGAANTVLVRDGRLIGTNTDRSGFASGLTQALPDAALGHVLQLGAGGAGSAVADALLGLGVGTLSVFDPARERAEALRELLDPSGGRVNVVSREAAEALLRGTGAGTAGQLGGGSAGGPVDGLVNASPVGMFTHPGTPIDPELLMPSTWVADIVYRPTLTELITRAAERGCHVMPGGFMAVGQAADTFTLVTGHEADRERMSAHFDALVAAEVSA